jgi:pimeloyl-ACP methyl ester carboxylesterase
MSEMVTPNVAMNAGLLPATGGDMSQEKFFDTAKVKINYFDYGSSSPETLVMLHGGAWCWQEYLSLIPSLSERWRTYALDLRGNGRSGWVTGHYRLEDCC